ncbi:hypothetical protein ACWDPV_23325 [Gordonia sp. NPDC003504]
MATTYLPDLDEATAVLTNAQTRIAIPRRRRYAIGRHTTPSRQGDRVTRNARSVVPIGERIDEFGHETIRFGRGSAVGDDERRQGDGSCAARS